MVLVSFFNKDSIDIFKYGYFWHNLDMILLLPYFV